MMSLTKTALACTLSFGAFLSQAAGVDAEKIGKSLTTAGSSVDAEDGLPKFEGNEPQSSGWSQGKNRGSAWKYKGDKPLYVIDASNYTKYASELSAGQQALFKINPEYKMAVYPTRRTCGSPEFVAANTRENARSAKLSADGAKLDSGVLPGIPFPGAQTGLEIVWNGLLRYSGIGLSTPTTRTLVSPRAGSDSWIESETDTTLFFPLNVEGKNKPSQGGGVYQNGFVRFTQPAALAGQALVTRVAFGEAQESYFYFPGQRRVRRMPSYAYDAPILGYENQLLVDQSFVFNGSPDRFDWKLIGVKKLAVGYNAFGLYDNELKKDEVLSAKSLTEKVRRYEIHKVYVVEATVKSGLRHSAPKRIYYFDVDTYMPLVAEDYDAQGKLWKVREGYSIPAFELGNTCVVYPYAQYDLQTGRYVVDGMTFNLPASKAIRFYGASDDVRFKPDFYTQDNLRAISER